MTTNDPLAQLKVEGLTVTPRLGENTLRVTVIGAVEMRDPGEVLTPYWTGIDDEARRRGLRRVELDVKDLSYMNSSGILTLVRWITRAKGHEADAYQLVVYYDGNVTWQRTSIPTLAKLAPQVVVPTEING
jgi:ABC-type transporter Mla MlaB component